MIMLGDVGPVLRVTVTKESDGTARNISAATTRQIIFRKPGGTVVAKTASLTSDGSDGRMQYTIEAGLIDEAGTWKIQGFVVIGSTELHTEIGAFTVGAILK